MSITSQRPGPEPKGDRAAFTGRYPRHHLEIYRTEAAAAGIPLGDYLAIIMARAHNLDAPDYVHRNPNQPELYETG